MGTHKHLHGRDSRIVDEHIDSSPLLHHLFNNLGSIDDGVVVGKSITRSCGDTVSHMCISSSQLLAACYVPGRSNSPTFGGFDGRHDLVGVLLRHVIDEDLVERCKASLSAACHNTIRGSSTLCSLHPPLLPLTRRSWHTQHQGHRQHR